MYKIDTVITPITEYIVANKKNLSVKTNEILSIPFTRSEYIISAQKSLTTFANRRLADTQHKYIIW